MHPEASSTRMRKNLNENHGNFDVDLDLLEGVGGPSSAGTIWLAVKFSSSRASAESLITRPLLGDWKSNHSLASSHLRNGFGTQVPIVLVRNSD